MSRMFAVMHHLMGTAEIAIRLGVTRQRVQQLVTGPDFPKPDHELIMGNVWRTEDIEEWIRNHRPEIAEAAEEARSTARKTPRRGGDRKGKNKPPTKS